MLWNLYIHSDHNANLLSSGGYKAQQITLSMTKFFKAVNLFPVSNNFSNLAHSSVRIVESIIS